MGLTGRKLAFQEDKRQGSFVFRVSRMKGFVYIMTNDNNTVLYTGVTRDLKDRIAKHKEKHYPGSFTSRYNILKLVYFECFASLGEAIKREKQIKSGSRKKKLILINSSNPEWKDLNIDETV
jgi:putative endonuclease